jgi:hypothetical protein
MFASVPYGAHQAEVLSTRAHLPHQVILLPYLSPVVRVHCSRLKSASAGLPKRCAERERDGVAFGRWKPLSLVVSQVDKHPRSAGAFGMVRHSRHEVEV